MHAPVKPSAASSPRWIASQVLQALASLAPRKGDTFTNGDLFRALPAVPASRVERGRAKLVSAGLVASKRTIAAGQPLYVYTVTADGAAAIQAAAQGAMLLCGNRSQRPAEPGTLRARLWALLRIRQVLDAEEAASLLCDAGGNHTGMRAQCSDLLRLWAKAGHLQISAKQGQQGRKRYVMSQGSPASAPPRKAPQATPASEGGAA